MKELRGLSFIERMTQTIAQKNINEGQWGDYIIIESIKENLQILFNSKKSLVVWNENLVELEKCIFNYGLEGLQGFLYDSHQSIEYICREIEKIIFLFEKRLKQVKVSFEKTDAVDHLSFLIEGIIADDFEKFEVRLNSIFNIRNNTFLITMKELDRVE